MIVLHKPTKQAKSGSDIENRNVVIELHHAANPAFSGFIILKGNKTGRKSSLLG